MVIFSARKPATAHGSTNRMTAPVVDPEASAFQPIAGPEDPPDDREARQHEAEGDGEA
jgi:hypothetical protein